MLITNKYARKLIWGITFALFCSILFGLYSLLLQRRNRVVAKFGGGKNEIFSMADLTVFFIMTFLASIRLNVGSDYYNYFMRFNDIKKDMSFVKDIIGSLDGYRLLSYIIKQFTSYEYAIFGVVAIVLYGYLFHLIRDEVEDRSAAFACYLFLGFFANSLNIIKQCIAMMFIMCFYKCLRQKQFIRSVIFAFFASLFHFSAIFAIVIIAVFTVVKLQPSRKLFFTSIAVGIILAILLPEIIRVIIRFVPSASGYEVYLNWRRNGQIRLIIAVAGMSIMYAFLLFFIVKNRMQIKKINEERYSEIVFLIIGLCINIASIRIWIVQRMSLYFYQFIILVLPTMFQSLESKQRKKIKELIYFVMFVYLIFSGIFFGENEYNSYNTVFSGGAPIYDADFNRILN